MDREKGSGLMRYLGLLAMAIGCIGIGFLAADGWKERLEILKLLRQMIYHLKGRILYANETLPEALGEVGSRFEEGRTGMLLEPGKLFLRVKERMEQDRSLPFFVVWKEEIEKLPADFPMDKADRQALVALGENLGYADREMQERTLLFYLEQTDDSIRYLKKELEGRMKLYRSLGMAGGLFLLVVLA